MINENDVQETVEFPAESTQRGSCNSDLKLLGLSGRVPQPLKQWSGDLDGGVLVVTGENGGGRDGELTDKPKCSL
jgi:hypothetical protein